MIKKLMILIAIMLLLSAIGAGVITLAGSKNDTKYTNADNKIKIVTTIDPVYLIGLNIANQIENVEVDSLINRNTGCLHDYQLTTKDMKLIASADVLVINGGGMESFLEDINANYPNLTIIDASQGITMLRSIGGEQTIQVGEEEEHGLSDYNPHVWLNPMLYIQQIENVRDGLIHYINTTSTVKSSKVDELTKKIDTNAETYINKVKELDSSIDDFKESLLNLGYHPADLQVVIFHDSFAYLANRIGMKVAFTVPLEADTSLSAGNIAEIVNNVKKKNIKYLFTEEQYSDSIAKQIEKETNAKVYTIDSAVTGDGTKDSYLKAMKKNLDVLIEAIQ